MPFSVLVAGQQKTPWRARQGPTGRRETRLEARFGLLIGRTERYRLLSYRRAKKRFARRIANSQVAVLGIPDGLRFGLVSQ
jgi:hypothetical protein